MYQTTNRRGVAHPQIWFRVVHIAPDGRNIPLRGSACRQKVEVALGLKGVFIDGQVVVLARPVTAEQVVRAVPERRGKPRALKQPKLPRVVELLHKASEWQVLIASGQVKNQAEVARREGLTRSRVTQIMSLLRLAPEIRDYIDSLPPTVCRPVVSERALRPISKLGNPESQRAEFRKLLGDPSLTTDKTTP